MIDRHDSDTGDGTPMDPVALTLAIWLGLIVAVIGLDRIAKDAAAQATLAQAAAPGAGRTTTVDVPDPFNPRLMAFGG